MNEKQVARNRRRKRVRKKVGGTQGMPRLSVFRSNFHIYTQLIDDLTGGTLVSASTLDKEIKKDVTKPGTIAAATEVGKLLAKRALAKKYKKVVFDRSGYLYHGRVKAVAEGAREEGLSF